MGVDSGLVLQQALSIHEFCLETLPTASFPRRGQLDQPFRVAAGDSWPQGWRAGQMDACTQQLESHVWSGGEGACRQGRGVGGSSDIAGTKPHAMGTGCIDDPEERAPKTHTLCALTLQLPLKPWSISPSLVCARPVTCFGQQMAVRWQGASSEARPPVAMHTSVPDPCCACWRVKEQAGDSPVVLVGHPTPAFNQPAPKHGSQPS